MSDDAAILQLMQTPGVGGKTLTRLLERLAAEQSSVEDLLVASRDELVRHYGLRERVASAIGQTQGDAIHLARLLSERGVRLISITMSEYPAELKRTLKDSAPPVLFVSGNTELLLRNAVAICGSRDASAIGLHVSSECARTLADSGVNIVSGYANGIDVAAHRAALAAGGVTTLVLAEGILHFRVKRELEGLLNRSNSLVISEFPPQLGWIARNAMLRNRTICGLADVVIAVESGTSGGTFAAGQTALELKRPLFVVDYPLPIPTPDGNRHFLQSGALALSANARGDLLNSMDIFDAIESRSELTAQDQPTQLSLDASLSGVGGPRQP